jgi:multimeric flavodoxin WrbA
MAKMALILDGARPGEPLDFIIAQAGEELTSRGYDVNIVELRKKDVAECEGCIPCWTKTSGTCQPDAFGQDLLALVLASDLLVLVTPLAYGCYSSELMKAMDRFLPDASLQMEDFKKHSHRKEGYSRYPSIAAIGFQRERDDEMAYVFNCLVMRNAINLHAPHYATDVVLMGQDDKEIRQIVVDVFSTVWRRF